jgi:hypothetical protein
MGFVTIFLKAKQEELLVLNFRSNLLMIELGLRIAKIYTTFYVANV